MIGVAHVAGEEQALADQEQHGHAEAAEDFEVDPELVEGEGDEQVGAAAEDEEDDPGQVQADPERLWQRDSMAHDALDQRTVADEMAGRETQGEQPVDHRRLPLEEGLAMEGQGHAAEHQAGDQRQPLALLQSALGQEQGAVDHQGSEDQHRRGAEDPAEGEGLAGQLHGPGFQLVDDEKQDQRNEIDELFHFGSQKRDVAA